MSKKTYWIIATALFAISVAFHSLNLDFASYELDEAVHIWYAQKPYSQVIEHAANDPNPPVFNLAISTWIKAFGVSEISTRFFSSLMASLAVLALFLVGSRNFGLTTGVFAALFLCFSPILFRFTHLARPYTLMMFTVVLSYGALFEHIKKSGRWTFVAYWLATALMIYAHPTSIFNVAAQFLIILLYSKNEWKNVFASVVPLGLALLTFAVWVLAIPFFEESHRMWFGPPNWDAIVNVLRMFYSSNTLIYVQLGLLALILISGLARRQRLSNYIGILAVACWVIIPFTASIVFSHMIKPIFQDKYILSVQPGMMLLLAVSIGEVVKWNWLRIAGSGLVVLILATSVKLQPPPYGGDWKGVVNLVESKLDEKTAVIIIPSYEFRTFGYYFDPEGYRNPNDTYKRLSERGVFVSWGDMVAPWSAIKNPETLYLIRAHSDFVELPAEIDSILQNSKFIEEKQFPGIKVTSIELEKAS